MSDDEVFKGRALAAAKARRLTGAVPPEAAGTATATQAASARAASPEAEGRMADISAKPAVAREAVAEGFIRLQPETLAVLAAGNNPKGDPFAAARIAAILAAKKTPEIIPLCHPLPLTAIEVDCIQEERGVRIRVRVKTTAQTGVEMEALTAAGVALLTVWDMTKALEKDDDGQYPDTAIEAIRVLTKRKGAPP